MSEIQIIQTVLEKTARRRRWQRAWGGLWRGFLLGAVAWLLAIAAFKLFPLSPLILAAGGLAAAAATLTGFIVGWWRRPSLLETARWLDGQQRLQERLSTALEVLNKEEQNRWRDLLVSDAARNASQIDPRRLLPFHLPSVARWAVLVLIMAAGLGFVPEYRSKAYLEKQAEQAVIRDTGKQLAELTRRNLEQRPPALEPTRKALDSVVDLGEHLAKAQLTRNDALKDLASVTERVKEQAKELGRNPAFKTLERASRASNKGGTPGSAELQKQIEALQRSLSDQGAGDPKKLEKLQEDLQKAKEAAAGLANADAAAAEAAKAQIAQTLSDLAQQAKDLGLSLPSLDEAIAALAASQIDQLLRDLEMAENNLEKLLEMAKTLEQLQMQAEKVGKDLAEQLQFGQAEAAQGTLEKMIQKLQSPGVNSEELQKMLEEVSKAVRPGEMYGKAGDFLKQAAQQLQSGQKSGAAQSLAAAAKELENLLQQLKDAEALMASLEALQRAQMCVGNGQRWGDSRTPRAGRGGGVGAGVGTWADDSRWMDLADIKDRWDNSGVNRADEDARGITDRGEAQLADNFEATKIKGQITPGGPMPSITLKGVSIKGVSRVEFKEMATSAQTEAQSALSQEQVPRAYQGAVRDYFDDLKK